MDTMSPRCIPCDRTFNSDTGLKKHIQSSRAHKFDCTPCKRYLKSEKALQQHLQNSLAHTTLSSASSHSNQVFTNGSTLQQHLRNPLIHQQPVAQTPLDVFFRSFSTFQYDPTLSPNTSYTNLQRHEGWHRNDPESDAAWETYQSALQSELQMWFSADNDLTAWHVLCRAVSIVPLPNSCQECEQAVRRIHVNIIDLIVWGRSGSERRVEIFDDVEDLAAYTRETHKIFRRTGVGSGNVVVRHLLRKIF